MNQGLYFQEYSGFEIHKYTENCLSPVDLPPITTQLQSGLLVFVNIFGSWDKAEIILHDGFWAETRGYLCPLEFDKDDRHCWTCSCAINKLAIQRIKL